MANTPRFKFRTLVLASLATVAAVLPIATAAQACARLADWIMQPAPKGAVLGANTLTGLIPTLYEAMNVVSREMVGFIPAVRRDTNADRAAVNQVVRVPLAEAGALEAITPAATPANSGDTTVDYADVAITSAYASPIRWSGEEERAVGTNGTYNRILADQFVDAMRKLVNQVEIDTFMAGYKAASRAYGSAGTAPFGTAGDLSGLAGVAQILDDNGCPNSDRQLVVGSAAMANLRGKQSVLFKVNEAGSNDMLRDGMTERLQNMAMRYSGGISQHVKGAGVGYDVDLTAGYAIGAKTIHLDGGTVNSTGIKAGDIITHAGDSTNAYVVNTGTTATAADIIIGSPGLLIAGADANEITIGNSYAANVMLHRNAVELAMRSPAKPAGGDAADDVMVVMDPHSGLVFEISVYKGFNKAMIYVAAVWGKKAWKPDGIAILMG